MQNVNRRWNRARTLALCACVLTSPLLATPARADDSRDDQVLKTAREDRGIVSVLLFYVPNRVFDVLDLVRLRVRVGPGIAARVRATEGVDVGLGSYAALYVGLPGPRGDVEIPLPIGPESYAGIELGPGDAEVAGGYPPDYTDTEFGASVHAALVGLDIGVDPFEVLDLAAGFALIDLRGDDF